MDRSGLFKSRGGNSGKFFSFMNTGKDMDTRSQMSKMSRGTQMLKVESQCFESEMERLSNSKGTDFCKLDDDDE